MAKKLEVRVPTSLVGMTSWIKVAGKSKHADQTSLAAWTASKDAQCVAPLNRITFASSNNESKLIVPRDQIWDIDLKFN